MGDFPILCLSVHLRALMCLMALEPTKESLMATFAQWLRDQSNGDPMLQELKNFASVHAATWPWWSDTRADYEALVQTVQDDNRAREAPPGPGDLLREVGQYSAGNPNFLDATALAQFRAG